jgi:hypothetical protein
MVDQVDQLIAVAANGTGFGGVERLPTADDLQQFVGQPMNRRRPLRRDRG